MQNKELFIHLNYLQYNNAGLHVWMHTQHKSIPHSAETIQDTAGQVYNAMIHEKMIAAKDHVLIFDFRPLEECVVVPIVVWHVAFPTVDIEEDELLDIWTHAIAEKKTKTTIISAVFEIRKPNEAAYLETHSNVDAPWFEELLSKMRGKKLPPFAPIVKFMTLKPIPYLV